jgi:hypothetical protein
LSNDPGDNTGVVFGTVQGKSSEKEVARLLKTYFDQPAVLRCGNCNGTEFWIYLDQGKPTGMCLFQCKNPNCKKGCPPLELHMPQMNDMVAGNLGIYVPPPWLSSAPKGSSPSRQEMERFLMDTGADEDDD